MEKILVIISLLIVSVALLKIGYNAVKNTQKTIDFFYVDSHISKTFRRKILGNKQTMWMKINGYCIIFFALILIITTLLQIIQLFK